MVSHSHAKPHPHCPVARLAPGQRRIPETLSEMAQNCLKKWIDKKRINV